VKTHTDTQIRQVSDHLTRIGPLHIERLAAAALPGTCTSM
jgi:hypothetical protein